MSHTLNIGDTIAGEFTIHKIFGGEGKSGMGIVYLVSSRHYPRPYILKSFQNEDANTLHRFRAEGEVWVSIGIHPNIVQAFYVTMINEHLYIGAEYIPPDEYGRNTVTDYLRQGRTSISNIIKWAFQFCYGMEYAREKGLRAHRDIKPDNLMVDHDGNLKITDFGISKYDGMSSTHMPPNQPLKGVIAKLNKFFRNINEKEDGVALTEKNSFYGSILYASPEQIIDSSKVDIRSDIYSFGIVLHQLLTSGAYPYSLDGKSKLSDFALMHLNEPIVDSQFPLSTLVFKCLARDPNDRYQSFELLLTDLTHEAYKLGISVPPELPIADVHLSELYIQSYSFVMLGKLNKAQQLIDEYLRYENTNSSALSLKGRIEMELGNIESGLHFTLLSYKIDPINSTTCNNLGLMYKHANNQVKAIHFFEQAILIDPYNSGAMANLAIVYSEMKNYDSAIDYVLAALELAPDKDTLLFNASNIAALAIQSTAIEKAIFLLQKLTTLNVDNANNWINLGLAYAQRHQVQEALMCLKYAEAILPNDEEVRHIIATLSSSQ